MEELLLGCGSRIEKQLWATQKEFNKVTTLDINKDHNPDVIHDLEILPLPFTNSSFDEIHAYDVLEHTGKIGDWKFFFDQWSEFHRILKPKGLFFCISPAPNSAWAFGDPGHTRVISLESLVFLSQEEYHKQVGITPMTDYRFYYKSDFKTVWAHQDKDRVQFVLTKLGEG